MLNLAIDLPRIDTGPFLFGTVKADRTALRFDAFIRRVNRRFRFYPYMEQLIAVLQRVADGEIDRLMVFMPPRHGKSETVSRLFAAYYLSRRPDHFVGLNSYSSELAYTLSRSARENYLEAGGRLNMNAHAVRHWETGLGGGLWAAGVGGPITGKGFHCLHPDSLVMTKNGRIRIEDFYNIGQPMEVLSFNHDTQKTEWKRVRAASYQPGKPIVEVRLNSGCRVRCTAEHLVYSIERGYVAAGDLVQGETLIQDAGSEDLCDMWQGNRAASSLQRMLCRGAQDNVSVGVCQLWNRVHERSASGSQVSQNGQHRPVLFKGMQPSASQRQESTLLQGVREAYGNEEQSVLSRVSSQKSAACTCGQEVSALWEDVSSEVIADHVLFADMCRCGARDSDARGWEQPLQGWTELCSVVSEDAPYYLSEGRASLCGLRKTGSKAQDEPQAQEWRLSNAHQSGCASFGRETREQQSRQFDYDVRRLPQVASYESRKWQTVTVSGLSRPGEIPHRVYDLQVEGNCNLFADGVLLHNCGIIDDPLKNSDEASSTSIRRRQKDWYRSTFLTRAEPGAAVVIIQTRWNEDDLCGWLLAEEESAYQRPERWHIVSMPAIAEAEPRVFPATCILEPDHRQPGEALSPDRYDTERLAHIQQQVGGYFWAALYQQRPAPREGGYFKRSWFPIVGALPAGCRQFVRYWDKAATPDGGAHTAGVLMARGPDNRFYVCDVVRGQWSVAEREATIEQTAHLDQHRRFEASYQVWVEQEPGSGGKESAEATITRLAGFAAYKEPVTGSKELRAEPFAAQAEVGNVSLLEGAWNADYIEEMAGFPHGAYKDQVDASSGAFNKLAVQEQTFMVRYR